MGSDVLSDALTLDRHVQRETVMILDEIRQKDLPILIIRLPIYMAVIKKAQGLLVIMQRITSMLHVPSMENSVEAIVHITVFVNYHL